MSSEGISAPPLPAGASVVASAGVGLRGRGVTICVGAAVAGLAFNGGSYALTVRNPVGIALWGLLALGVMMGLWPLSNAPRAALGVAAALAGLTVLAALSALWADSAEATTAAAGRNALYLGVFAIVALAARR